MGLGFGDDVWERDGAFIGMTGWRIYSRTVGTSRLDP